MKSTGELAAISPGFITELARNVNGGLAFMERLSEREVMVLQHVYCQLSVTCIAISITIIALIIMVMIVIVRIVIVIVILTRTAKQQQ